MYGYFKESVTGLVELLIYMGLIMHILPGEQYRKYVKLLLGIVMIAFILDTGSGAGTYLKYQKKDITELYNQKLNFKNNVYEKTSESQYLWALSTLQNKINSTINNSDYGDEIAAECVEIKVCEDVNNVDYGKVTTIKIRLSKNVDKSGNIVVDHIIIGKQDEMSDDLKIEIIRGRLAEALGVNREVIQFVFS